MHANKLTLSHPLLARAGSANQGPRIPPLVSFGAAKSRLLVLRAILPPFGVGPDRLPYYLPISSSGAPAGKLHEPEHGPQAMNPPTRALGTVTMPFHTY
jgi:hypothetical protein